MNISFLAAFYFLSRAFDWNLSEIRRINNYEKQFVTFDSGQYFTYMYNWIPWIESELYLWVR